MYFKMRTKVMDGQLYVADKDGNPYPMKEWNAGEAHDTYLAMVARTGKPVVMTVLKDQSTGTFMFLFFDNDGAGFSVIGFTTRQVAWSWYENSTGDTRPAPRPGQDRRDLLNSGTDTLKVNSAIHPGYAGKMDIIRKMKTKKAEKTATDAAKFEAELKDADLSVEHVSLGELLKEFPLSLESPIPGPKQEAENVIPRAAHTCMASRDATVGFCPLDVPAMEKMNSEDTPSDVARAELKKWIMIDAIKKPPVSVDEFDVEVLNAIHRNQPFAIYCGGCFEPLELIHPVEVSRLANRR